MKLFLIPAVLLALAPRAEVRLEADGIRVGSELVTAPALALKEAGARPILVSKSAVESLGSALAVEAGGLALTLEPGVRLARAADGFVLSTHGPALLLVSGTTTLRAEKAAAFTVSEKGFDFGTLGSISGTLVAKVEPKAEPAAAAPQVVPPPRQDPVSPERRALESGQKKGFRRRTMGAGDPMVGNSAAIDKYVLLTDPFLSPFGN
jgi:hypothetical protein